MHDISLIITASAIIGNLTLGVLVLKHDSKNKTHQIYFTFIIFLIIWMASSYILDENVGENLQLLLLKLTFCSGVFAAYFLFLFSNNFPKPKHSTKKHYLIITIVGILALLSTITNLIVIPQKPIPGAYYFHEGILYPFYTLSLISLLVGTIVVLFHNLRNTKGRERLQVAYLLLGLSLPISIIMVFTLIIPMVNPNMNQDEFITRVIFHRISLVSTLFYTLSAAYAIIRHRLFGIRVILGEILFWLAGSALVFLFFYGTIVVELRFFDSLTDPLVIFLNVFIALLVFPTLRATNNWLRRAIRKITINVSFDRDHILSEYNKEITQSQATLEIVNSLFRLIDEAYTPKFAGLILIEQRSSNITAEWRGLNPEELMIAQSEEAITQFFNETSVQKRGPLPGVDLQLLFEFPEYQGVLVLGDRKDTAAYANEDVQFLEQVLTYTALNLARTTR